MIKSSKGHYLLFICTKHGEIPIFITLLAKNSISAYISLKSGDLGKIGTYDVIVASYTKCLFLFWNVWNEVTHSYTMVPNMVPNKHTSGVYFSSS